MSKLILALFATLLVQLLSAQKSFAGFILFEPGVGYMQGHYNLYAASGLGFDVKLGARLGTQFFVAGNYVYATPTLAPVPPASGAGMAATMNDMGATLGWDLPGVRIMYTYIFTSELTWTDSAGKPNSVTGKGYKIGIAGKLTDSLKINMDAIFDTYDKQVLDTTETKTTNFLDVMFLYFSWKIW